MKAHFEKKVGDRLVNRARKLLKVLQVTDIGQLFRLEDTSSISIIRIIMIPFK